MDTSSSDTAAEQLLARADRAEAEHNGESLTNLEDDLGDRLAHRPAAPNRSSGAACPSCGHEPGVARDRWQQREDLAVVWLYADSARPGQVVERRHCVACQPHERCTTVVCSVCGDGPMIARDLAELMPDEQTPPVEVRGWLTRQGWRDEPGAGLVCAAHEASGHGAADRVEPASMVRAGISAASR